MGKKFIINYKVSFSPDEHRLKPLGSRGSEIVLNAPVSRILLLLLQNAGEVVRQEDIFKEVWEKHGQVVAANTLYQNVSLLRKGLLKVGIVDESIRTHPKTGFVFKGKVQIVDEESKSPNQDEINSQPVSVAAATTAAGALPKKRLVQKIWAGKKRIHFIYLTLFLFIGFYLLTMGLEKKDHFIITHSKIANVNQCPVYVDQGNLQVKHDKYIDFLKEKEITCSPTELLYITRKIASNDVIILLCDTDFAGDMQCSTKFKMTK